MIEIHNTYIHTHTHTHTHTYIPWNLKFVIPTIECGVSLKDTKIQIKAATTKQKQHRNNTTKPQTNIFPKYCKDHTKKEFDMKYMHII
jgi:hypothetical protein